MSRMDLFKDALTSAVDRAARSFDETLESELSEGRQRIAAVAKSLKDELPSALLGEPAFNELIAPRSTTSSALLEAAAKIDEATDQGSVLVALLDCARGFCGRSLFILAHESELEVWSSDGFEQDDALAGKRFAYDGDPWRRLRQASGVVHLSGDDCTAAAAHLGVSAAEEAICVPFMLRDRLGGFLYADRRANEPMLDSPALRLLTHLTALDLETLAIRGQDISPTLRDDADEHDALPIYAAAAAAAAAAVMARAGNGAEAPVAEDVVETASVTADAPEVTLADLTEEAPATVEADGSVEDLDETYTDGGPTPASAPAVDEVPRTDRDTSTPVDSEVRADVVAQTPATTVRPQSQEADDLFGEDTVTEQIHVDASFPTIGAVAEEPAEEREGDTLELEPLDPSMIPSPSGGVDNSALSADDTVDTTIDTGNFELDDPRFPAPSAQETASVEATTQPAVDPSAFSEDQTIMSQRSAVYKPPTQSGADEEKDENNSDSSAEAPARKGTQVVPPSDLSGPGSAFLAGGSDGDEALREEARRLARLLVSEIKLYNEDQLEEGRREGSIYNRLKEDIDRSRKMYHERIDPRLQDADQFFYQELVDRLAGGSAELLGM